MTMWDLPNGRRVEQREDSADFWILWILPNFIEYCGDAEGLQTYLARIGVSA